jgi:hypothetical protein
MVRSRTAVVFLSYRRSDTSAYAGRLTDALERKFGRGSVFHDIEAIAPGTDFVQAIDEAVHRCEVLLVLIGNSWLHDRAPDGNRRLDDPNDFVRLEVGLALRAGTPVLPVLVEGASMPGEAALPEDLRALARLQAVELSDTRWAYDVERVTDAVLRLTGRRGQAARHAPFAAAAALAVVALAAGLAYLTLGRTPDLSGRWDLPNGSFWTVLQEGERVRIEETHYDSKQVWKRGAGTIERRRLDFSLELVYGKRSYHGSAALSADRNALTGTVLELQSGTEEALALTRAR